MISFDLKKTVSGAQGPLLLDFEARLESGESAALFGPSGSGKTTLLRMLAGLAQPESGRIEVEGETWYDSARGIALAPQKRRVGFVFQDYALFPTMTVRQNLSYALEKGGDRSVIGELLSLMELEALADRHPETLSGGQRQRVALARALVRRPKLLLLDEPLSALDLAMRRRLQDELVRVQRTFAVATLLVSHDPGEVVRTCARVLTVEDGRIGRSGTPQEIFGGGRFSGKFRFQAELLSLEESDVTVVASLLVGNEVVRVALMPDEAMALAPGDRVTVASKAFNPVLWKEA
jgi:molybdate transport system ATP-binding protein